MQCVQRRGLELPRVATCEVRSGQRSRRLVCPPPIPGGGVRVVRSPSACGSVAELTAKFSFPRLEFDFGTVGISEIVLPFISKTPIVWKEPVWSVPGGGDVRRCLKCLGKGSQRKSRRGVTGGHGDRPSARRRW